MKTCNDCLYQTLCDLYSNLGVTDIPASDVSICDLFKNKADVAEVVRCKDCEYFQDNNDGYPHKDCKWRADETPDGDDFCSYGVRKENE